MPESILPPTTQALLKRLKPLLLEWKFYLAGGTGLALQIGHRISEDLDFFRATPFDTERMVGPLRDQADRFESLLQEQNTLVVLINGIRLGFFQYEVPLRYPFARWQDIPAADWRDILAEKFKTVSQRGSKKDFYDLYEILSRHLVIQEAVRIFKSRFAGTGVNFYHVLRSLTYFEDAEGDPEPRLIARDYQWNDVKQFFIEHIHDFEQAMESG
ncbi:MAG: nucleotidyl transferase AbiEii/AbiGii toxin family protein [Nitrospirae bacterium]|nr:nucleotidyl transferase AbiEii/AbiGii toxin family protein [Nitrospirota bacterium]